MTPVILPATGPAPPAAAVGAAHPAILATVADAPPAAARLDVGSIVTGTVLGRDSQGLVNIRTDRGVLALATNANLPVGSTVSLEVRVAGAHMQVIVLSVEPPPGPAPTPLPATGTPGSAAPPTGTGTAPAPTPAAVLAAALSGGSLVMATVVRIGHPAAAAGAAMLPGGVLPAGLPPAGAPSAGAPGPQPPTTLPQAIATGGAATAPSGMTAAANIVSAPGQAVPSIAGTPPPPGGALVQAMAQAPNGPAPAGGAALSLGSLAPGAAAAAPAPGAGGPSLANTLPMGTSAPIPAGQTPPSLAMLSPASPAATGASATGTDLALAAGAMRTALPAAAAPLPFGSQIAIRIHGAALPGEAAPIAGARPEGAAVLLTATVAGQTPAGHPIVDTDAGRLVLAIKTPLPAGSTLLLEIPSQAAPGAGSASAPATTPQQALLRLAHGWPALGAALAALGTASESAAAQMMAARLPQTGPGLAAGMLSMMARFAAGDGADWLPPAVRGALSRSGRGELADRLHGEFRQLSRLSGEPMGGDWRVMFLPLRHENELHQINLYLRGQRHGADADEPDTGTRFIVEIDMTRLGPIQLDGLVHGRRFDLMLRSRLALSAEMRRDIEAIFETARGIGGFAGTLGFQTAASFPVRPLEQASRQAAADGVVV